MQIILLLSLFIVSFGLTLLYSWYSDLFRESEIEHKAYFGFDFEDE